MAFMNNLERRFGRYAIPNITIYLIMGQVLFFIAHLSGRFSLGPLLLIPGFALTGEWWRFFTFIFIPPVTNPIFAFFAWYLFYLMGSTLEEYWGAFRFNLFLFTGYLITIAVSFLFPMYPVTNIFIGGSVFLAFAFLYPDFELLIFFILPVKVKWLALLAGVGYAFEILAGSWPTRLSVLASLSNFFLFFSRDIYWRIKTGNRRMIARTKNATAKREAFHRCAVCGITDLTHPEMDFRYCQECGGLGYCTEHIRNHEHVKRSTNNPDSPDSR